MAHVVSSPGARGSVLGLQGGEHNIVAKVLGALREAWSGRAGVTSQGA